MNPSKFVAYSMNLLILCCLHYRPIEPTLITVWSH